MLQLLEGSRAIALAVKMCQPGVVSAFPITPQTHIVEDLAKFRADGEANYEFVRSDSEFASASIVLGASATGVRAYTATSSQGLLLMTEVLFNIAGIRLPVVITCVNRAISAPLNIWNDQQDSVTIRDSGWLQLYAENNQEAVEMHIQAFQIAENTQLPVMVNVDGFILSHTYEPVELPSEKLVSKFLGKYHPVAGSYLDIRKARTFGYLVTPKDYQGMRQELFEDVRESTTVIKKVWQNYNKQIGSQVKDLGATEGALVSTYKLKGAKTVIVAMGGVLGTIKTAVDELNKSGARVGVIKIKSFRPFPDEELRKILEKVPTVVVLDRAISCGAEGILVSEVKRACYGLQKTPKIIGVVSGLGGRDITVEMVKKMILSSNKKVKINAVTFI